jgi:EmrB/QacA subfamily drug resistance transporter
MRGETGVNETADVPAAGALAPIRVVPHPKRWMILRFALVGQLIIAASVGTVNVALPSIRSDLQASPADLQWVIVLYQLVYAILLISGGRLGDIFGRRRLFLLGTVGFVLASAMAGFAPNVAVLIMARILQGVGGGLASPQILALVQVIFPAHERSRAFSRFAMTSGASFTAGQLITGGLLHLDVFGLGWRAAFLMNVPPGIVAVVGAVLFFPNPTGERQRLDIKGTVLISAAMLMLLYPLIQGRKAGWPPLFFFILAGCVPVAWLFIKYEWRLTHARRDPLLDMHLFEARSLRLGLLLAVVTQATFFPAFFFMTITLQSGFGYDPWKTALTLTPTPVALVFAAAATARLMYTLGRKLIGLSALCMATSTALIMLVFSTGGDDPSALLLVGPMALLGVGQGFVVPTVLNIALLDIVPEHAGTASGIYQTVQQLTAAVGVAVLGIIFFGHVGTSTGVDAYVDAFVITMSIVLVLYVVLFAVQFLMPKRITR